MTRQRYKLQKQKSRDEDVMSPVLNMFSNHWEKSRNDEEEVLPQQLGYFSLEDINAGSLLTDGEPECWMYLFAYDKQLDSTCVLVWTVHVDALIHQSKHSKEMNWIISQYVLLTLFCFQTFNPVLLNPNFHLYN